MLKVGLSRPAIYLVFKLKAFMERIKEWSKSIQGNLELEKLIIFCQLPELEETRDQRNLNKDEMYESCFGCGFEETAKHEEVV